MPTGIYKRKKKGIYKKCEECGKEFYVPKSLDRVKRCSKKCSDINLKEFRSKLYILYKNDKFYEGFPKGRKNPGASKWWREHNPMKLEKNKMYGSKNPNWRGGICDRLSSLEWLQIRQLILERDKFTCQKCGLTHHKIVLDVHHKIPWRISYDNSPENLISLCRSCHAKITLGEEKKYFINLKGGN